MLATEMKTKTKAKFSMIKYLELLTVAKDKAFIVN